MEGGGGGGGAGVEGFIFMDLVSSLLPKVIMTYKGKAKYSLGTIVSYLYANKMCSDVLNACTCGRIIPYFSIQKLLDVLTNSFVKSFIHFIPKHTFKHHVTYLIAGNQPFSI